MSQAGLRRFQGSFRLRDSSPNVAVTFVVPVHDKAAFLGQCLESLREQSLHDTEIVCIDDASTDDSGEILDGYRRIDPRVRVVRNDLNRGAGESRNVGIELARGRFLRFVDADDLLPASSTESMYERAVSTGADVVRGTLALFRDDDPADIRSVVLVPERTTTTLRTEPSLWIPWWHTSYLISRDLIHRNGLRYPSLRQGEDPVFLASVLVNAQRISLIPDVVYLYRKYQKSTGSGQSTFVAVNDLLDHAEMVKSLFASSYAECWHDGYGPFLLEDFRMVLRRCALDESQMQAVASRVECIWKTRQAL